MTEPTGIPVAIPPDSAAPAEASPESPSKSRRVAPNPDKPRLPARVERRLAAADQASAAAYEASEDATAQLHAVAEAIKEGEVRLELEIGESIVHVLRSIATGGDRKG